MSTHITSFLTCITPSSGIYIYIYVQCVFFLIHRRHRSSIVYIHIYSTGGCALVTLRSIHHLTSTLIISVFGPPQRASSACTRVININEIIQQKKQKKKKKNSLLTEAPHTHLCRLLFDTLSIHRRRRRRRCHHHCP